MERKVTVPQSKAVEVIASTFTKLVTWEESAPRSQPDNKPSKDLLPYLLGGTKNLHKHKTKHTDKGDEHRKLLAASLCVKRGTVT